MNRIVLAPSFASLLLIPLFLCATTSFAAPPQTTPVEAGIERPIVPANPEIDMPGYLKVSEEAARHRLARRVSEDDFIRMSRERGTVVLDARSRDRFDDLHVEGALHLDFADITVESLARLIPDRTTRILIYCNNNFAGDPRAFPAKIARASLNLSTYIALYSYGYRNVYELAPTLEVEHAKLKLVPTPHHR